MARIPVAKGSRGRDAQDDTLDGGQDARCTRPRAGVGLQGLCSDPAGDGARYFSAAVFVKCPEGDAGGRAADPGA